MPSSTKRMLNIFYLKRVELNILNINIKVNMIFHDDENNPEFKKM